MQIAKNTTNKITTSDIEERLLRYFMYEKKCYLAVPRCYATGSESDVLAVTKTGYIHEIEIKISVSDFRADIKKNKWGDQNISRPNYFWYCFPKGMIDHKLVPDYAGIIEIYGNRFVDEVRTAPRYSKNKVNPKIIRKMTQSLAYRVAGDKFGRESRCSREQLKFLNLIKESTIRNDAIRFGKSVIRLQDLAENNIVVEGEGGLL